MRTNPKNGKHSSDSAKSGSALPRTSRRRTPELKGEETVALTGVSEETIQNEIARLAYFFWQERGGAGGSPEEDWLRAEQEILARSLIKP